jgi:hypothetical protein
MRDLLEPGKSHAPPLADERGAATADAESTQLASYDAPDQSD